MSGLKSRCVVLLLAAPLTSLGQTQASWSDYRPQLFRWNETFSDSCAAPDRSWWLDAKCLGLGESKDTYVSFGAEYRLRVDDYDPYNFGVSGSSRVTSTQQRALAHADVHFGNTTRWFTQLGYGHEEGRPIARPGDNDDVDFAQLFVDYTLNSGKQPWHVRIGRQEIALGRFVAIRDATNLRLTFDALRVDGHWGSSKFMAVAGASTR